jgi:hypothetical protein
MCNSHRPKQQTAAGVIAEQAHYVTLRNTLNLKNYNIHEFPLLSKAVIMNIFGGHCNTD